MADRCHLSSLQQACTTLLACRLGAAGAYWRHIIRKEQLEALSSETLAVLACEIAEAAADVHAFRLPPVFDVEAGLGGAAGGFTVVVPDFSKYKRAGSGFRSCWVTVGGIQWRVYIYPNGTGAGKGNHLSGAAQAFSPRLLFDRLQVCYGPGALVPVHLLAWTSLRSFRGA